MMSAAILSTVMAFASLFSHPAEEIRAAVANAIAIFIDKHVSHSAAVSVAMHKFAKIGYSVVDPVPVFINESALQFTFCFIPETPFSPLPLVPGLFN